MKKSLTYLASAVLLSATMFTVGCGETESVSTTTEATGPGGTTEVHKETTVEKSGSDAPAVPPATTPAETTPATP